MENPFTQVFDALWVLVDAHALIDGMVEPKNRIKYNSDTDRGPFKSQVSAGDVPELILVSNGLTANLHSTSTSSMCTRRYTFLVSTGDFRHNEFIAQVEWLLFTALANWKGAISSLKFNNKTFAKRLDIASSTQGESDQVRNRGLSGWSAAWTCEIEMHFQTSELIDVAAGT